MPEIKGSGRKQAIDADRALNAFSIFMKSFKSLDFKFDYAVGLFK